MMYNEVQTIVGSKVPIIYHERGKPPDLDKSYKEVIMWCWRMEWYTSHLRNLIKDYLRLLCNHEFIITKDELPDMIKAGTTTSRPYVLIKYFKY